METSQFSTRVFLARCHEIFMEALKPIIRFGMKVVAEL